MTPREYVDQVVRPNLADLTSDPASIRFALNAVHSVDALAARIFHALGGEAKTGLTSDDAFRNALSARSADFHLVRDLASSLKHIVLDRPSRPSRVVNAASSVEVKALGFDTGYWDELKFDMEPEPVVALGNGSFRIISAVLSRALAFLEAEMETYRL